MRLRDETQLLGRYEGSAYEQPTYLVRRDDGQVIHLSHLLYLVAVLLDGERDLTEIAEALSTQLGRHVVADNVEHLVEKKLRPSGLIASSADDDQATTLPRSLPLLALRYRRRVIPARLHRGVTTALQPAFWPPIVLLVLGGFLAFNVWLFGTHRAALTQAVHQLPFHPGLFLLVTLLVIFSGFFHELGHATATRYGGGSPGVMGVGIYLAWPAFYTDLTDAYRLNRTGRLRADLGGVYFNALLIVAAGVAYITTGFGPLAVFIVVSQAMAMYQFLPFIRMDGYYIVSDLVGVPNLFAYLGPVLHSMFRRPNPVTNAQLHLLKRRARVAIKIWSVVTIVFLAFNLGGLAILAPIIIPSEWAAIHLQGQAMAVAFARGSVANGVNDLVDLIVVAIAPAGMLLIAGIFLRRAVRAIRKWWPTHPKAAAAFAAVLAGALLFQGQALISRFVPASSGPTAVATRRAAPAAVHDVPRWAVVPPASSPTDPLTASQSGPVRFCVVQPNDTLWGIAAQYLGDPDQWPAIFALNAGLPQPDGRTLVDPDLIYPGWRLELPGSQPAAVPLANPGSPVVSTEFVLVRRVLPPPSKTGAEPSATAVTPPSAPTPAGSEPVNPPFQASPVNPPSQAGPVNPPSHASPVNPPYQSTGEQASTLADGASPTGPPSGGTVAGAELTSARLEQPTTDQQSATAGNAPSPRASPPSQVGTGQVGTGQVDTAEPEASPTETASRSTPPSTLPAANLLEGLTQGLQPAVDQELEGGLAPAGLPGERGPPAGAVGRGGSGVDE